MYRPALASLVVAAALAPRATAAVHVNPLFTDPAALQRDRPVPVWGTADPNEPVTVHFGDASVSTAADAGGRWSVSLPTMPASDVTRKLTIRGRRGSPSVKLTDELVGDVWICGGQSNMGRQLGPRPRQPHVSRRLVARDGPLRRGFEVANADGKFVPATATVRGDVILVHADAVPAPEPIRFSWEPVPDVNLNNVDGLPASPLTTALKP